MIPERIGLIKRIKHKFCQAFLFPVTFFMEEDGDAADATDDNDLIIYRYQVPAPKSLQSKLGQREATGREGRARI